MMLMAMALAAASVPSAQAERLGRQLADAGMLAALLPLMKAKEIDELVREAKALSATDKARLRATAERTFDAGRERLLNATGHAYAERLSIADLKLLVAFHRSATAKRAQAALPEVIASSMQSVGQMDFKGDVRKAFCAKSGKLCPAQ